MNKWVLILIIVISLILILFGATFLLGPRALYAQNNYGGCKVMVWFGQTRVRCDNKIIFTSPREWLINDVQVGDANNDGQDDLVFALWKRGSYGPSHPFWEDPNDDNKWSSHLFIYTREGDTLKMKWGSSALENPIYSFEITSPGKLDVKESLHTRSPAPGQRVWNGWGFDIQDN